MTALQYNEDGSVKWGEQVLQTKKFEPHLQILRAINEVPFNVGKRLLIDILQGNDSNKAVKRNKLDFLMTFGTLAYSDEELYTVIDELVHDDFVEFTTYNTNYNWKVLQLTEKGRKSLDSPDLFIKSIKPVEQIKTEITDEERILFNNFDFFLNIYNDEQKKAITSSKPSILCVAGAGSGKTTVLTKRIEFLVKFRSVDSAKILAITFTRKARQEMQYRLALLGHPEVKVETFNSFCEKILRKYNDYIYDKPVNMMSYSDKIKIFTDAIASLGISVHGAIDAFFTVGQKKSKTDDQLFRIFMNDCFFIVDYYKVKGIEMEDFSVSAKNPGTARRVYNICGYIEQAMKDRGLRDHTDQIVDALNYLKKDSSIIPEFSHVLVDEYQDVNDLQIELLEIFNAQNNFYVGDPRQSIFGWRGSNINYILDFEKKKPGSETINLTKNYRSTKAIVHLMNDAIKQMKLPDLEYVRDESKSIKLLHFHNEEAEFEFILQGIIGSLFPKEDIFVLARTNRQLNELSKLFHQRQIPHVVKSDEQKRTAEVDQGQVTLATIHAIKGLEAKLVFVMGCTYINFPCRGNEHPVVELIKVEEYDKDEEEKRLFYVAISRAKEALYLTYSGRKHTSYITDSMKKYYLDHVKSESTLEKWV